MLDITKHQYAIKYFHRTSKQIFLKGKTSRPVIRGLAFFAYITTGSCLFTMNDGTQYQAKEGTVLFVSKGCCYDMEVLTDQFHYIVSTFAFVDDVNQQHMLIKPKNSPAFEKLFHKMLNTFDAATPYRKLECMSLLYQIYTLIIQDSQSQYVSGSSKARIEKARIWCLAHLDDPELSIEMFARMANMSKSHFRVLFQNLYGITPIKYIVQERIAYAKQLMTIPELQLEEIALQSGFSSLSYFCKVFKASTDTTPGLYRQKLLEQQ